MQEQHKEMEKLGKSKSSKMLNEIYSKASQQGTAVKKQYSAQFIRTLPSIGL